MGGGQYYYWQSCFDWCNAGETYHWLSEESNGIPGLQVEERTVDTTCHGMIPPDSVIL